MVIFTGTERYLAMGIGAQGRLFNLENLLSRCDAFELNKVEATEIFEEMKLKISKWSPFFSSLQVSKSDIKYLQSAFEY